MLGAVIMAGGAPVGLLIVRALTRDVEVDFGWVRDELGGDPSLYLYLIFSTSIALSIVGFVLGRYEDRLAKLSLTDSLTGLMNRRHFGELVTVEVHRALRYRTSLSVLLIDVDNFKQVNDRYGHAAGDAALISVAQSLMSACRSSDMCARFGGDEFAALLPGTPAADAARLAERLGEVVRSGAPYAPGASPLTLSIGVAELHATDGGEARALLGRADKAMYDAKQSGRDRTEISEAQVTLDA